MEIRKVRLGDEVVGPLLDALRREYQCRYGSDDEMLSTVDHQFDPPSGLFVVVLDGLATAAGGGYRYHAPGVCEVKRMWTNPAYRRQGLAARVLEALESEAAAAGYRRMVLETGSRQPEAAALYVRRGYRRIDPYGEYPEALAFEAELRPGG